MNLTQGDPRTSAVGIPSVWCRACGITLPEQHSRGAPCPACNSSLEGPLLPQSRVGLVYEMPGKMKVTKRFGICTRDEGSSVELHFSAKDVATVQVDKLPDACLDLIAAEFSPAARMLVAHQIVQANETKTKWDGDSLLALGATWATRSAGVTRRLADEAIHVGWSDVLASLNLTPAEKCWRQAHASAQATDLEALYIHLAALPNPGYEGRIALLLPFVGSLRGDSRWVDLIREWKSAGISGADFLDVAFSGNPQRLLDEVVLHMGEIGQVDRSHAWGDATKKLLNAAPELPPFANSPMWTAAALYHSGVNGRDVTTSGVDLAPLTLAMLDDLIDAGAVTVQGFAANEFDVRRDYLLARLQPSDLDDDSLANVGHEAERARRFFLKRDFTALNSLDPSDDATIRHYQALATFVTGKSPRYDDLRPDVSRLLELAERARTALTENAARSLPRPIVDDPTLWSIFAAHARSGQLSCTPEDREEYPRFAQWVDLQRLVGLLWEERWSDAALLGQSLSDTIDVERLRDESLNLTAFALTRLGRTEDALRMIDVALEGDYTEALLVNTCILAAKADPATASEYFARLVREAPTSELRSAALRRAITVWRDNEGEGFPPALIDALRTVLRSECTVDDYRDFIDMASVVDPAWVRAEAHDPGGDYHGAFRLYRAFACFRVEPAFGLGDLADEIIATREDIGTPQWYLNELTTFVASLRESLFVEFGEATGSAIAVDRFLTRSPELLDRLNYFLLSGQAGAHMAVAFTSDAGWLNDQAFHKFFFLPIEQFLAGGEGFDKGASDWIADNFSLTLFVASHNYLETGRRVSAAEYNPLSDRLRWDAERRFAILNELRAILDRDLVHIELAERALERMRRLPSTEEHANRVRLLAGAIAEFRDESIRLRSRL